MLKNVTSTLSGYVSYRGRVGHAAFLMHRVAGLATVIFLTMHILTTATVFFAPQWYERLIQIFRNPVVMLAEIAMAYFVIYHGVNGLRIAYFDLFRPDLWGTETSKKSTRAVWVISFVLWLPALAILGYNLLKYGFGLFGGE